MASVSVDPEASAVTCNGATPELGDTVISAAGGLSFAVTVTWDVYLKTLDRKLLAGPIRQRQLRKEVAASLVALADSVRVTGP